MHCQSVFVLLSLFVAVVSSQNVQACIDAQNALNANQSCFNAFSGVVNGLTGNTTLGVSVDLNVYCAADCRDLVNRMATACDDGDDPVGAAGFMSLTRLVCTIDADNTSCFDFLNSPEFEALGNAVETSGVCPDEIPPGQTCPSACQAAFQNFVIDGGCCVNLLFDIATGFDDEELESLLAQCPIDLSLGGTCTEIGGGATGLKAFGSVLLFAVIFVVQTVI